MTVREFPALQRRLRWLTAELSAIERQLELEAQQGAGTSGMHMHQILLAEQDELDFILRYYQRQTNGALSRMQWMVVAVSMVISLMLLILLVAQRMP
jgi:di/tricarboxylate transporter